MLVADSNLNIISMHLTPNLVPNLTKLWGMTMLVKCIILLWNGVTDTHQLKFIGCYAKLSNTLSISSCTLKVCMQSQKETFLNMTCITQSFLPFKTTWWLQWKYPLTLKTYCTQPLSVQNKYKRLSWAVADMSQTGLKRLTLVLTHNLSQSNKMNHLV